MPDGFLLEISVKNPSWISTRNCSDYFSGNFYNGCSVNSSWNPPETSTRISANILAKNYRAFPGGVSAVIALRCSPVIPRTASEGIAWGILRTSWGIPSTNSWRKPSCISGATSTDIFKGIWRRFSVKIRRAIPKRILKIILEEFLEKNPRVFHRVFSGGFHKEITVRIVGWIPGNSWINSKRNF